MENILKKNPGGFTLLELIIVLAIAGIVMAVSVPKIFKGIESTKSRNLLSNIVMFFREARMDALSNSNTITVLVKFQEGVFEADNDKKFTVPEDSNISIGVEDDYLYIEVEETSYSFYPNGMASGAKLIISSEDNKLGFIFLDPLTGLANYSTEFDEDEIDVF